MPGFASPPPDAVSRSPVRISDGRFWGEADMHGRGPLASVVVRSPRCSGPLASVVEDPTRTLTIDFCCDAQLGSSSARQIAASMIKVVA